MGSAERQVDRTRRRVTVIGALAFFSVVVTAAIAASGGSVRAGAGALVKVGKTRLGNVVVDQRGRTLYLFEPDEYGRSVCTGKCATFWPPLLTTGTPRAGAGVQEALLGSTKRGDGKVQVTYRGYPLYLFLKDTKRGQTLGQGVDAFGGEWYVLDPRGRKIEDGRHGGDPAVLKLGNTALGRVLTDERGRTVYLFEADKGTTSACYGKCATSWPPLLTTGTPQAGAGTQAGLLGTTKRRDGTVQVTYHGHPLYYFARDAQAGQALGEGIDAFSGEWYAVSVAGIRVEHGAHASGGGDNPPETTTRSTTTTSEGGGGYGGGYG
jgi:predicted lipoprotein with Yx(FWY)xxD motif